MQRHEASAVCVAALVLLAGTATLAGAASTTEHQQTVGTATPAAAQQQADNATEPVNVTVETLRLRNVSFTNVSVSHVHVLGNVTSANGTVIGTQNGTKTVENITAQRLLVTNATLHNVSFTKLTVRNESVARALFGNDMAVGNGTGERTIESATLENLTVEGLAIEHGTLRDARLVTVQTQGAEIVGDEAGVTTPGEPAIEIHSVTVGNATVEQIAAVDLSIGNETAANETTEGGGES